MPAEPDATAATASARSSRRVLSTAPEFRAAMLDLEGAPSPVPARDWPGRLGALNSTGLYSWWVDEEGATDLSRGLGHLLPAGRIYAGQTGATKWPSGRTGGATLASRIGLNHLRGRIRGSTFRLTLASVLMDSVELVRIGPHLLDSASERSLSAWMSEHLRVAVHRFSEHDALGDLEARVLAELDPALNLKGMPPSPIRTALKVLRTAC